MNTQTGKTPMPVGAFRVEQEVTIQGSPARVFDALTKEVSAWWGMPHMYSEEARDIILEPNVGGRLFEDWGNGEGVLYATVTIARRPEWLRLTGPIGIRGAVAGVVDIMLEPKGQATVVRLSHRVVGEVTGETEASYDREWKSLLGERLKPFVERGERTGLKR